jgi:hypothetical protein
MNLISNNVPLHLNFENDLQKDKKIDEYIKRSDDLLKKADLNKFPQIA